MSNSRHSKFLDKNFSQDKEIDGPGSKIKNAALYSILSFSFWPLLMCVCMSITAYGFANEKPMLFFNIAYVFLIVSLFFLERKFPHEKTWQKSDGQTFANIAHTFLNKGLVQALLVFGGVIGLAEIIEPGALDYGLWPTSWPLPLQIILGVVASEFALYWSHRLSHEWPFLWRFHAVHHSVVKLWFVNTGRFHFIDSLLSVILGIIPLVILGAPMEIIQWQAAITAFIGMLTHCNVDMRFGPISWFFNTPGLHRWHHSKKLEEGNRNYGENVMVWDQLFGTYINPNRRPPADIGIPDFMPEKFSHQLIWPFLTKNKKQEMQDRHPKGMRFS